MIQSIRQIQRISKDGFSLPHYVRGVISNAIKQAKQILVYYLQEAVQFEGCCIRIIHGKGQRSSSQKPVLKTHVNHWLEEHERVLAFHYCKIKDGGAGAVYVLLKRQD